MFCSNTYGYFIPNNKKQISRSEEIKKKEEYSGRDVNEKKDKKVKTKKR